MNLQKLEFLDPEKTAEQIDGWYVLRMATIEGARAIGLGEKTGSIAIGKDADLVLMSKRHLGMSPIIDTDDIQNLVPLIIYSADERAVDTVMATGKVVAFAVVSVFTDSEGGERSAASGVEMVRAGLAAWGRHGTVR